ncbi:MAG: thiamine phosphate synthase [Clostridiaceae bacterium]|nr:thiamine phosphate synthase [Clostridiaceae bacterium]
MCKVIVVTNRRLCSASFWEQLTVLAEAGVDEIVLREKDLPAKEYEVLAERFLLLCGKYHVLPVLHQNVDVAERLGACALHLPLPEAQRLKPEKKTFRMGVSVHSVSQLEEAQKCGADYVFFGHVFPTDCKKGAAPRGLSQLKEICGRASVPVYAIGGISPENALQAVALGADGVCVMSWGMQQSRERICDFIKMVHGI